MTASQRWVQRCVWLAAVGLAAWAPASQADLGSFLHEQAQQHQSSIINSVGAVSNAYGGPSGSNINSDVSNAKYLQSIAQYGTTSEKANTAETFLKKYGILSDGSSSSSCGGGTHLDPHWMASTASASSLSKDFNWNSVSNTAPGGASHWSPQNGLSSAANTPGGPIGSSKVGQLFSNATTTDGKWRTDNSGDLYHMSNGKWLREGSGPITAAKNLSVSTNVVCQGTGIFGHRYVAHLSSLGLRLTCTHSNGNTTTVLEPWQ